MSRAGALLLDLFERFPGPVFAKDTAMAGRRAGTYWLRAAAAGLVLALVGLVLLGHLMDGGWGGRAYRLQQLQRVAPMVTVVLAWFTFIASTLSAIVFAAPSICSEVRAGTLASLLTTPLRAAQVVAGKVAATSVQWLVLALVPLPVLLAARVFGGVETTHILAAAALAASTAMLAACVTTLLSACSALASRAAAGGLVIVAILQFAGPLALWVLTTYTGLRVRPEWFAASSAPIALGWVSISVGTGALAGPTSWEWVIPCAINLSLAALFALAATLRLRRVMRREGADAPTLAAAPAPPTPPATGADPTAGSPDRGAAPAARRARPPRSPGSSRVVGDAPVLWRELQQAFLSRGWTIAILLAVACVAIFIYVQPGALQSDPLRFVVGVGGTILAIGLATLTSAGGIAGERESRSLDVLLSTPLTAREIVFAKFWGALRRQWMVPAILGAHYLVGALADAFRPLLILHLALLILPPVAWVCAVGTALGVVVTRSARAAALNFIVALALWVALPIAGALLSEAVFRRSGEFFLQAAALLNPAAHVVVTCDGSENVGKTYDVFDVARVNAGGYTLITLAFAAGYALASYLVLRWAAAVLARQTARVA